MRTRHRRRQLAIIVIAVCSLIVGGVVALAAALGDSERVTSFQVAAVLADDGLLVTEVIDYDFGPSPRRGIYRDIPDAVADSVSVFSPTAPDDVLVTERWSRTNVRIGDPDITITGRHCTSLPTSLPSPRRSPDWIRPPHRQCPRSPG